MATAFSFNLTASLLVDFPFVAFSLFSVRSCIEMVCVPLLAEGFTYEKWISESIPIRETNGFVTGLNVSAKPQLTGIVSLTAVGKLFVVGRTSGCLWSPVAVEGLSFSSVWQIPNNEKK